MADVKTKAQDTRPSPTSARGHPMPRRASPEQSVTLRHHRLARDASMRPEPVSNGDPGTSPRRNSSGESQLTGQSDPKKWFDRSNRNPPAAFDQGSMDDDYRSVIDDLTVENKRLKEELRRYKQFGPDPLRKDKLFEIKFHGIPNKKKRELEATLRDFASSLEGSTTSSQQRKKSKHTSRLQGSSSDSKHASSASSNSRPVDSAYASMSTGPTSSVGQNTSTNSVWRPSLGRTRSSAEQRADNALRDIPQGLMPRQVALTDKEKKKVVVRRLEQLFTGKFGGRTKTTQSLSPSILEPQFSKGGMISAPPLLGAPPSAPPPEEPSREARIQLHDPTSKSNTNSRGELSVSNCENEGGETTGSGSGCHDHSGQDNSPQNADIPEQRATRPLDLDPDRTQIAAENMEYIRHLGALAPEYLPQAKYKPQDVSMDTDGWIHLNLLCNLAQLHILNVTPDYIRSAVSERSAKFQLSRDGRKIRWRGGTHGTKFSSDSSGESSQRSPDTVTTDGSNEDGQRKKQKTGAQVSPTSTQTQAKLGPKASTSSDGFHYKPMFVHHQSSSAETSMDETGSQVSYPAAEESNPISRSTDFISGSGSSPRKKRRHDGAVIYYTGAPFCLDLSGDPGDISPTTHMAATGQVQDQEEMKEKPELFRTTSGSNLPFRPLVDGPQQIYDRLDDGDYVSDDTDALSGEEQGFRWCEQPEKTQLNPLQACLEPCGLGGVTPEDHFAILVVTRHPILGSCKHQGTESLTEETAESIANRVAGLTTDSPQTPAGASQLVAQVQFQVLQQRYKALKPLPLPPPAIFYPPFTDSTDSEEDSGFEDDYDDGCEDNSDVMMDESDEAMSQQANPYQSDKDFARMADLNSDVDEHDFGTANNLTAPKVPYLARRMSKEHTRRMSGNFSSGVGMQPDSSAATAGEATASGYSSDSDESG
ncbi:hypothetical protein N0V82_003898 [Gnomoniopsis sp. IMI 355080]|nr:hypothetical protein N0V82_003898 [Gnomoniopsis sp. IMI 355080]